VVVIVPMAVQRYFGGKTKARAKSKVQGLGRYQSDTLVTKAGAMVDAQRHV
jgi:hypothetical protein